MSLADATATGGVTPPLPAGPPYACDALSPWAGLEFALPPGDRRLPEIHAGGPADTAPLDNLVGAARYWAEHPDWMEFLDPDSPSHDDKMVERALYLEFWEEHMPAGARVLDVGGGVGRFMQWMLRRGCAVELVDPDLRSLWRAVQAGARVGAGALDVHWSTGERLPPLPPVDLALMVEVLCYVEDPARALQRVFETLRPGGTLLCSVEARWGWAMASDVHPETIESFLDDGIVHVPGDRWVRTYTEADLRAELDAAGFELVALQPSHFAFSGPFEECAGPMDEARALALESRLRAHPVAGKLNRAWMVVARRPAA